MASVAKGIKSQILKAFQKIAEQRGFDLVPSFISTLPPSTREVIKTVRPFTMTSEQRLASLCDAIDYIERRDIPGEIVECGVWKGGSSMAIALSLLARDSTERDLYLYDTFDGMSQPTEHDKIIGTGDVAADMLTVAGKSAEVWAYSPIEEVQANLATVGYPSEKIKFIRGKVEDTIPGVIPKEIALLRLDTDWYELRTKHELDHLFPLLSDGGVLIIDDYGHWDGARKAVDDYFSSSPYYPLLFRVDYSGRMTIKSRSR